MKVTELLNEACELLETVKDDEQEYYDNMPEGLQAGEKGQKAEEVTSSLEDIHQRLEEAQGELADLMTD